MPAVAVPSMNSASVNFGPRPQRRCTAMKMAVPNGRQMNANEKITNDHSVPYSGVSKGKKICGKTATQAMPNTKKSKYSDARPMTTPTAISPGATLEWPASWAPAGYCDTVLDIRWLAPSEVENSLVARANAGALQTGAFLFTLDFSHLPE